MGNTRLVDQTVRRSFPHPVAAAWHRASLATSDPERIKCLLATQEILIRTMVAMLLPDYLRGEPVKNVEQLFPRLERPALGHWVALMREMLRAMRKRDPAPFMPEAVQWYLPKGRPSDSAKLLDELITIRNLEAHGHTLSPVEAAERATHLTVNMRHLMDDVSFLAGYRPFRVIQSKLRRRGGFTGRLQFLVGVEAQPEPSNAQWTARLFPEAVYIANPAGDELLEVSPFLQVLFDSGPRQDRVFLLSSTKKSKMLVLSNDSTGAKESLLIGYEDDDVAFDDWLGHRGDVEHFQENEGGGDLRAPDWGGAQGSADEILGERFEVRDILGEGGMATVYLAWDQWEEQLFALKVLRKELSEEVDFRERFKREARTMRRLRHPNILRVEETSQLDDGRLYLKLPVVNGGTLRDRVKAGGVSGDRLVEWTRQMLSGLKYLHEKGVVHRDIKPSNYLLDAEEKLYLADFGIALQEQDTRLTRALEQMGSMAYMSPEQRRGGELDGKSDVYSLGVVIHELATGEEGSPVPGKGIEGALGDLVRKMTEPMPSDRPSAADALAMLPTLSAPVAPTPPPPMQAPPELSAPATVAPFHHHGPAGREVRDLADIVAGVLAEPDFPHMLWRTGWAAWKPWTEVAEVAGPVQEASTAASAPPPVPVPTHLDGIELETTQRPAGSFQVDISPVTLSRGFEVLRNPVSASLYAAVVPTGTGKVGEGPKVKVTWHEALRFCNALSERHRLTPVYNFGEYEPRKRHTLDDVGRTLYDMEVPDQKIGQIIQTFRNETMQVLQFEPHRLTEVKGFGKKGAEQIAARWDPDRFFHRTVQWVREADGWRLPTEAEWVWAVENGDDVGDSVLHEWTWDHDSGPVYAATPVPLTDNPVTDPTGADGGPRRLVRGKAGPRRCLVPEKRQRDLGFRIVRTLA